MKKKFMIMFLAILALNALSASAEVQFGAKVGIDLTNFLGTQTPHGMKLGYQAGLMLENKFETSNFGFAPEIVFAAQGGRFAGCNFLPFNMPEDKKATFHTNYINFAFIFKYYFTPTFTLDFGPQVGVNVYSKFNFDHEEAVNVMDDTQVIEVGIGLGCTYNITHNAFVQTRYTMGITKAFNDVVMGIDDVKNGNIQLAFGMKF